MEQFSIDERNKVRRVPQRGQYDKASVFSILDAGFLCHVSFAVDGQPFNIPMAYGRKGDVLYLHGATKSRLIQRLREGIAVCICVTHLDGIVLARSAFHHSMNYRSAVLFGKAGLVDEGRKEGALRIISEQIVPGRWAECRPVLDKELKATHVLAFQIEQASAKIRSGPPKDETADYDLPVWAGVLPMQVQYLPPEPDPDLQHNLEVAESVRRLMD